MKLVGAGGAGAGLGLLFGESKQKAVEFLIPQPVMPEDYSPGIATWYNTVCRQCAAGCGIMVRTREGRAKKIEGNPAHPVNEGKLCALGQSSLNGLYNPDRITAPLALGGDKGSGVFNAIDWGEALGRVAERLTSLRAERAGSRVHLLTGGIRGHLDRLFNDFMQRLGSDNYLQYEFDHPANLYAANRRCFGIERLPFYDIRNTDYLLSFGADYLGSWLSPVHYGLGYGHLRQGRPGRRGHVVQIEARMSLSGANADEWIPAKPGSEGVVALAMAQLLVREGVYGGADAADWAKALARFTPDYAAEQSGMEAGRIVQLARAFAGAPSSLALGGGAAAHAANGVANLVAVNVLNYLAGRIGNPGGVLFNPVPPFGGAGPARLANHARMQQLADDANAGRIQVLIVHGTNPVFTLPEATGLKDALRNVPLIVALSDFMDETTALADLVLPTHHFLESWGDDVPEPGVGFPVASLSQPVVKPLYDTKEAGDIVLALAQRLELAFPWNDTQSFIRDTWREIYTAHRDRIDAPGFDAFWVSALQAGVWGLSNVGAEQKPPRLAPAVLTELDFAPPVSAAAQDYAFSLQPYLSQAHHDGRGANLPWMQELPDPLTSVVYASWVELNPKTAQSLGIREGDVLEVTSPHGSLRAPAFIYPAIMPDVVSMPIGQGHTAYGRYAQNRGANPLRILGPDVDKTSGALAWTATRVNVRKTGERIELSKTSGMPRELGRNILGKSG